VSRDRSASPRIIIIASRRHFAMLLLIFVILLFVTNLLPVHAINPRPTYSLQYAFSHPSVCSLLSITASSSIKQRVSQSAGNYIIYLIVYLYYICTRLSQRNLERFELFLGISVAYTPRVAGLQSGACLEAPSGGNIGDKIE